VVKWNKHFSSYEEYVVQIVPWGLISLCLLLVRHINYIILHTFEFITNILHRHKNLRENFGFTTICISEKLFDNPKHSKKLPSSFLASSIHEYLS
jgi:hypothetical protein